MKNIYPGLWLSASVLSSVGKVPVVILSFQKLEDSVREFSSLVKAYFGREVRV